MEIFHSMETFNIFNGNNLFKKDLNFLIKNKDMKKNSITKTVICGCS